jgi:hypothetical protein
MYELSMTEITVRQQQEHATGTFDLLLPSCKATLSGNQCVKLGTTSPTHKFLPWCQTKMAKIIMNSTGHLHISVQTEQGNRYKKVIKLYVTGK